MNFFKKYYDTELGGISSTGMTETETLKKSISILASKLADNQAIYVEKLKLLETEIQQLKENNNNLIKEKEVLLEDNYALALENDNLRRHLPYSM